MYGNILYWIFKVCFENIWVGAGAGGIQQLNLPTGSIIKKRYPKLIPIRENRPRRYYALCTKLVDLEESSCNYRVRRDKNSNMYVVLAPSPDNT